MIPMVAAIIRDDDTLLTPEPSELLGVGDRLVVIGRPEHLVGFRRHVIDP